MEEKLIADFFKEEKKHWWHVSKRTLIREFISGSNLKILVIGIGGGAICSELKEAGHRVVGVDNSVLSCDHAKKNIGIPVIRGDLEQLLMFTQESFDCVIIADVLEHLDNDRQLLTEVFRCLKNRGSAIITVPAYPHLWSSWDVRLHHRRRYSLSDLKMKILDAGFTVRKIAHFNMLLYLFVYIYRKMLRLPRGHDRLKSDFAILPAPLIARFISFYYVLERKFVNISGLPFGLSIFAIGVKHG